VSWNAEPPADPREKPPPYRPFLNALADLLLAVTAEKGEAAAPPPAQPDTAQADATPSPR
jgi:hypothetical protein